MIANILSSDVFQVVIIALVILLLAMVTIMATWKKVPNDHAAVIVGPGKPRVVSGGGTIVIPLLQRMDTMTLEGMPLNVIVTSVKTSLGVPINAEGYVVIKVKHDDDKILTAMQMFYCQNEEKTKAKIIEQAQKICEGKLREIASGLTVEEIYDDRDKFSASVLAVVSQQLDSIGLELKSFTINDITDDDDYIESLGKAQIARVKATAAIAQAESARDQAISIAESTRLGTEAELRASTQIAQAEKEKQMLVLEYRKEQESKKAEADAAYDIQKNITMKQVTSTEMDAAVLKEQRTKDVREAEIDIQIAAEERGILLAGKKAERKEAELLETMVKPAEAKKMQDEIAASANKTVQIRNAEANAESLKLSSEAEAKQIELRGNAEAAVIESRGKAEAEAIRLKGLAEAEALSKKAEALAKMDDAGRLQMVMDKLPEIARAVSEPMSKIGNITIIGGGGGDNDGAGSVARSTMGALKTVIEGMKDTIGFDLTEVMRASTFEGKTTQNVNMTGLPDSVTLQMPDKQNSNRAIIKRTVAPEDTHVTE